MRWMLIALTLVFALPGCGDINWNDSGDGHHDDGPGNSGNKYVAGTITTSGPEDHHKNAEVIVRLVDRANGNVMSEQRVDVTRRGFPVPFQLRYSKDDIKERRTYDIEARVRIKGKLKWITKQRYPVITQGHPTYNLNVLVEPN